MSSILKGGFVQLTGENVRVIDTNEIVKKRMAENESSLLREARDQEEYQEDAGFVAMEFAEGDGFDNEEGAIVEGTEEPSFDDFSDSVEMSITLDPEEVRKECDEMIKKAQEKAEAIKAEAKEYARTSADIARQDGYEEGKRAGYEELEAEREALKQEQADMEREFEERVNSIEPMMVEAITNVYEHVFGNNFFSRRDVMVCLINKALLSVDTDEQVIINVSPKDYDILIGMKAAILEKVSMTKTPEVRQREDFTPGMAKIETSYGVIDCSIDTELRELTRVLKMLSFEGHETV